MITWYNVDEKRPEHCGNHLVLMDNNPDDWQPAVARPRFTEDYDYVEWESGPYGDCEQYFVLEGVCMWAEFPYPPDPSQEEAHV